MRYRVDKKLEGVTWKQWILFLFISQGILVVMQHYTMPIISREAGGMTILDALPFGYSYEYVLRFIEQLTPRGYMYYERIQLSLDLFYPMMLFLFGMTTIAMIRRFGDKIHIRMASLWGIIPCIGMLADYTENGIISLMLRDAERVTPRLVSLCSYLTMIKSVSVMLFYSICLLFVIIIGTIRLFRIKKGMEERHDNI